MSIIEYVEKKRENYESFLQFLENEDSTDDDFQSIIKIFETQEFGENIEEFEQFLQLLKNIANEHQRNKNFINKIMEILQHFKNQIKQTFSNFKIFKIFKSNQLILLFLFDNEVIKMDEKIYTEIINKKNEYCHFFYPEIKSFLGSKRSKEIEEYANNDIDFDKKRHEGENDWYLCMLIRHDLIDDFVMYVNQSNIPLDGCVNHSIFETNRFLIKSRPTLIEYCCFFGSIQIFQYLKLNKVELTSSLWFYAIHSNKAEMFHLIEESRVEPLVLECFNMSIKCHHNEIAGYIEDNLIPQIKEIQNTDVRKRKDVISSAKENKIDVIYDLLSKLDKIPDFCFKRSDKLRKIVIPPSIKSIGDRSFYECYSLTHVFVPSSVTSIGDFAFGRCFSLTQITIPSSVTSIGYYAFSECSSLRKISISPFVASIKGGLFNACTSLTKISIPTSVTSIGNYAFRGCSSIAQISVPSSIKEIEKNAFPLSIKIKKI
ncbi:hypothetical protein M9Y10_012274 [Tritrichomonas musculus]|uniref:Surface antigen BspA-like n=1 Tax=Tritrichomonas musculus TaxID=1915356 RepID=A0ABR2IC36_9EUKA